MLFGYLSARVHSRYNTKSIHFRVFISKCPVNQPTPTQMGDTYIARNKSPHVEPCHQGTPNPLEPLTVRSHPQPGVSVGIWGGESFFSGESSSHHCHGDRLLFLGTVRKNPRLEKNTEVMVLIDSYLSGIRFCQNDDWCHFPSRCPQKLGHGFEKLGPEDEGEMVTVTDTGRDSGAARARASV